LWLLMLLLIVII
jgi:hypothetical protein